MVSVYHVNDISLGESAHQTGHQVYHNARYQPVVEPHDSETLNKKPHKLIVKKNKYGFSRFSRYEVAFTQLARLFMGNGLTSNEHLVIGQDNKIFGIAVEHLCYVIEKKEGLTQDFYRLTHPDKNCEYGFAPIDDAEDIPIYFLDKLPHGFFAELLNDEKNGELSINYESLASILASSYTLEEDDLHKGNFGFYLVNRGEDKPDVVFFKIDHDLMFVDSVMSFITRRPYHVFDDVHAFSITANDLLHFPRLVDSTNGYWPTKRCYLPNFIGEKEYHSPEELEAFASLEYQLAFVKAKWMAFYKHILLPTDRLASSLEEGLDKNNPNDRALISVMVQATVARQARLRAVLFSLGPFRDFVSGLNDAMQESLVAEIVNSCPDEDKLILGSQIKHSLLHDQFMCQSSESEEISLEEGDTPLHVAIKLGDFRYEETMSSFGNLVNTRNKRGKTPLDVALEKMKATDPKSSSDIRQNLRFTMNYLLKHGAKKNEPFNEWNATEKVECYHFQSPYLGQVSQATSYAELGKTLSDIGQDSSYCLKFKKFVAIQCIVQFIKSNSQNPELATMLRTLKNDINAQSGSAEAVDFKYIRQLRSKLWIIRQIRGLYGWTSSQSEINQIINAQLNNTGQSHRVDNSSFFAKTTKLQHAQEQQKQPDSDLGLSSSDFLIPPP